MKSLYNTYSSDPKYNAQRALSGRTHYVDDSTLKFHKSRILDSGISHHGLLFWLIESVSLDMHNTRRGFRYVIFDLFGTVISRCNLEDCFKTSKSAYAAKTQFMKTVDAMKITEEGIARDKKQTEFERECLLKEINAVKERTANENKR